MGCGISGGILLDFEIEAKDKSKLNKNFYENYNLIEEIDKPYYYHTLRYEIKKDFFLANYADFLTEFYDLLEINDDVFDPPYQCDLSKEDYTKKLLSAKSFEEFNELFEEDERDANSPFLEATSCFSCTGFRDFNNVFIIYSGSYKALLETYCTLTHMEKLLVKAMDNPLKYSVKFGIYG